MTEDVKQVAERLLAKYEMKVPKETASSILKGQPNVPVFLSRASFRTDVDVRTQQRTAFQRERRQFLHTILGVAGVSIIGLLLTKTALTPNPPTPTPTTYVSQPTGNFPSNAAATVTRQLLANASNIPVNQSYLFNDPSLGPGILLHLPNGQFVAYSSVCTHAGCQVQFDPSMNDLVCPCHGAVYDPNNNAQVLAGPAPYPLQKIPIQYDPSTGNIYLVG